MEFTNHQADQDLSHDDSRGTTQTPVPYTTLQEASRVVTPDKDDFIPQPFPSEKARPLKDLPKPSPNPSDGYADARYGFQSPPRPQVNGGEDRPLSPPLLQNYTKTPQEGLAKWNPISLHQEDNRSMVPRESLKEWSTISLPQGGPPESEDFLTILNFFLLE